MKIIIKVLITYRIKRVYFISVQKTLIYLISRMALYLASNQVLHT